MINNIIKNDFLVIKDNYLIEAKYKLSTSEQKLILILISKIKSEDEDFKAYRFRTSDFSKMFKVVEEGFYQEMIKITVSLAEKALRIYDPKKNETLVTNWFSSAKYIHNKGIVEFKFDPNLKPYLLQLKNRFTSYSIDNVIQLKSSYSIRIYELIKQYEKIGYRTFPFIELKKILGISEKEYLIYSHFRQRVLEPAKKEIAEKTDLKFTFTTIKEARKVCYIRFDIFSNTIDAEIVEEEKEKSQELTIDFDVINHPDFVTLIRLVPHEHQSKTVVVNVLTKYFKKGDLKYIARNIKYTNQNYKTNYQAYLKKSLKADWGLELQEEEEAKAKKDKEKQDKIKQQKDKEAEEKAENKLIEDYRKEHEAELREEATNKLDKAMKKELKRNTPIGRMALESKILELAAKKSA